MKGCLQPALIGAAAAVIGALAAWQLKPAPAPGPAKVQVDTVFAEAERPHLEKPSLGERITTARAKPIQTRVAAAPSSAALQRVAIYCRPPIALQTSAVPPGSDSATSNKVERQEHPAVLPDFAGRYRGGKLTLYSTLNDGRAWSADYTVRGHIEWGSDGDSANVRGDRWFVRLLRGAARCAPAMGASGAIGTVVHRQDPLEGFALGAGSTALGCLF